MASHRYRLAMRPFGLGDELRVALMLDGGCWGPLCLHRAEARAGFDPHEARLLARIGPAIAGALRRGLVTGRAIASDALDSPGVLVVNADHIVASATSAASRWLAELTDRDRPHHRPPPTAILALIAQLGATASGQRGAARARVRTPSGRWWLTVHAAPLDDTRGTVAGGSRTDQPRCAHPAHHGRARD